MFHHRLLGQFLVALLSTGFHRIHLGCWLCHPHLLGQFLSSFFHQHFIGFTQGERLFLTGLGSRRDLGIFTTRASHSLLVCRHCGLHQAATAASDNRCDDRDTAASTRPRLRPPPGRRHAGPARSFRSGGGTYTVEADAVDPSWIATMDPSGGLGGGLGRTCAGFLLASKRRKQSISSFKLAWQEPLPRLLPKPFGGGSTCSGCPSPGKHVNFLCL